MIYRFIDDQATFVVKDPQKYNLYFPLVNRDGSLMSSISSNLSGDIKTDNEHFLTPPISSEDIRSAPLSRREFFIKVDNKVLRMSHPYNDTLEAGFLYHKVIKKAAGLEIEITNFIPYDMAVEIMWLRVKNKSNKPHTILPTSFIPLYGRAEKNLRDHRHVSSLLNRVSLSRHGIILTPTMIFDEKKHSINQFDYFALGFEGLGRALQGQFPTLDNFYGQGDIFEPDAVYKDKSPVNKKLPEFDGKEACAGFRFSQKILKPGQSSDYAIILGVKKSSASLDGIFSKVNSVAKIKEKLSSTKQYWLDYLSSLNFDFKDRNFNNWLLWVKLQPALRKLFGCSFLPHFDYGKGGRGWRDLWQDTLTLLLIEPQKARDIIMRNFRGIRLDGSNATIITKEGDFISDRNRISRVWMDHGVWPYLTLKLYINRTGDLDILFKEAGYFSDHQIRRAKGFDHDFAQSDFILRGKDGRVYKGSILEHVLIQNLVQFFNVGKHNIIRLENADWNDGLDMAAENGESAAFSNMYAHNLKDLCFFLRKLKGRADSVLIFKELAILLDSRDKPVDYSNYLAKQHRLEEYFQQTNGISGKKIKIDLDELINDLEKKSTHLFDWLRANEWLSEGYFNGYYDNRGKRVEGGSKMCLTSQVFSIMSGTATDQQIKKTWASLKKLLWDKDLKGFRLNTDFAGPYMDLGRAFGFSYGDKENGAFFNHMVVMLANALYKRGFAREGFQAIDSIYKMALNDKAGIFPVLPEYFNGQGRGLYLYLTGSASWYIYTLLEEVVGIRFVLGDMLIQPRLASGNFSKGSIDIGCSSLGRDIKVTFFAGKNDPGRAYRLKKVVLNNKDLDIDTDTCLIPKQKFTGKVNLLKVYLD